MGLIELVIVLAILGVILYLIQTYLPMPAPIKIVITVIVVVVCCLVLLDFAGIGHVQMGNIEGLH